MMRPTPMLSKRQVEGARVLDEAVIGDDRDALVEGALDGRQDGGAVLGEDDERVRALRDELLDVRELLRCIGRRVGLMYEAPAASRAALMAGSSSRAQRSSLKLFQDTPTMSSSSWAATMPAGQHARANDGQRQRAVEPFLRFRMRGPPPCVGWGNAPTSMGMPPRGRGGSLLQREITALGADRLSRNVPRRSRSFGAASARGPAATGRAAGRRAGWRAAARPGAGRCPGPRA